MQKHDITKLCSLLCTLLLMKSIFVAGQNAYTRTYVKYPPPPPPQKKKKKKKKKKKNNNNSNKQTNKHTPMHQQHMNCPINTWVCAV